MRRFFLLIAGIFLLGTSIPGVANQVNFKPAETASTGDKFAPEPDSISHSEFPEQEEVKTGATRSVATKKATAEEPGQIHHEKLVKPESSSLNPGQNPRKKEEAPYSVSFNFLYYLFCKINFSEITKTPVQ